MSNKLIFLYVLLVILLGIRLVYFYSSQKTYTKGERISFVTQVLSNPKEYSFYQTLFLNIDPVNKVLVKLDLDKRYYYGDYLKITGTLDTLVLDDLTPIFTLNYPKVEANFRENNLVLAAVYSFRQKIINNFRSNLDPISSGLMLGIVFGIKENLPKEFLNDIQITGVMHVIAASGMNVTMVSAFLFFLFKSFLKRQLAISFSVIGIIFYAAVAGFEPSIVRASIMGIIVFSAQILGRQQFSLHTLLITAFVMLFVSPQLLFNTGFALSFSATLGLLYIPELFKKWQNSLTESFITTISAQIATLPILLTNFGNYSLLSIVVNGLVLWTIPLLMVLGGLASFFIFIFPPLALFFLYLCLPFLYFFELVIDLFAKQGNTLNINSFPISLAIAYYLFLISLLLFKYKK
ncbi:MAG: ComEC/Rec2 family competence protein [Patescibacteria group bacterium]